MTHNSSNIEMRDALSLRQYIKRAGIIIIILCLVLLIFSALILATAPPVSRDALIHHLALPKAYLRHGEILEMPSMNYSYYPMNVDLLYMLPLAWSNDRIPKYIHLAFGILTAVLIWEYLKRRCGNIWGLIGALFFLSTPVIFKLSTIAYVDLGIVFFSFAGILALLLWKKRGLKTKYLLLSAGFCGLALGTKYNGLMFMLIMMVLMPWLFFKGTKKTQIAATSDNFRRLAGSQLMVVCIAILLFSPWMLRNYHWTGNPVYPLYDGIFNPSPSILEKERRPSGPDMNPLFIRRVIFGETWPQILAQPLRIFYQGQDDNPRYFDGKINPFLLVLPLLAFIRRKDDDPIIRTEKIFFLFFSVLFLVFALFAFVYRARYVAPVIPPLIILSVFGLHNLAQIVKHSKSFMARKTIKALIIALLIIPLYLNAVYAYERFNYVDPLTYIFGKVSRDEFIARFNPEYPLMVWANTHLPPDARVLLLFVGNRSYYLDRDAHLAPDFVLPNAHGDYISEDINKKMNRYGTTHIIIGYPRFLGWLDGLPNPETRDMFLSVFQKNSREIMQINSYKLLAMDE